MMTLPRFEESEFYNPAISKPVGNTDVLIFVEVYNGVRRFNHIVLDGDLPLHDKILRYIGQKETPLFPFNPNTYGPFYWGNLENTDVFFVGWSSFSEFCETMDYEFMRRPPMSETVYIDGVKHIVEGRAANTAEFNHLYRRDKRD